MKGQSAFGRWLGELLHREQMTIREFAEKAGVSHVSIVKYLKVREGGSRKPGLDIVKRIANAALVPVEWILLLLDSEPDVDLDMLREDFNRWHTLPSGRAMQLARRFDLLPDAAQDVVWRAVFGSDVGD